MDGYNDLYFSDQYTVNPTAPYPTVDPRTSRPGTGVGFYEDNLRFQQYGQPARLICTGSNPYIQDDIRKSQRHNPVRHPDIQARSAQVARESCDWTLVGKECPLASGQKVRVVPEGQPCTPNLRLSCPPPVAAAPPAPKNLVSGIDNTTLLFLFIFVVLVYLCMHFWQTSEEVKGGLQMIRELVALRGG